MSSLRYNQGLHCVLIYLSAGRQNTLSGVAAVQPICWQVDGSQEYDVACLQSPGGDAWMVDNLEMVIWFVAGVTYVVSAAVRLAP